MKRALAFIGTALGLALWGFVNASSHPDGATLLGILGLVGVIGAWVLTKHVQHHKAKLARLREADKRRVHEAIPDPPPVACLTDASCEPNNHTYSWPCAWAPGTGHRWIEYQEGIRSR